MQCANGGSYSAFEDRGAARLVATQDRIQSGVVPITHDFLAMMLGMDRSSVSLTASILQRMGAIV